MNKAFTPNLPTVTIAGAAASASAALDPNAYCVRVYNAGPNKAFMRFTVGASAATVTDTPIAPNSTEVFTIGACNNVSAICSGVETASLYFTNGEGM